MKHTKIGGSHSTDPLSTESDRNTLRLEALTAEIHSAQKKIQNRLKTMQQVKNGGSQIREKETKINVESIWDFSIVL